KRFISFEYSSKHLLSVEKLASQPTRDASQRSKNGNQSRLQHTTPIAGSMATDASPHFYGSF
ncbi:hypothetical protein, partial [Leuconostoc mesenteroides]|uniref:hypothetical protein n=1 Tax=Leuconostoc mesenteroides TaxID=1245 RepID=UPI0023609544